MQGDYRVSKTYVIPDLHGRYDLMQMALESIEQNPNGGTVVFLGDYIDRGPQSRDVIMRLMRGAPDRWRWVCLKGNHEDMMVGTLHGPDEQWWLQNGGTATLVSYDGNIPQAHLDWCEALPTWHDDGKRIFVHAAVDTKKPMIDQNPDVLMWMRYGDEETETKYPDRHIIHGHTPNRAGPELYEGRTNLDTGAVFTGRLCIAVFDDDKDGGPVEIREFRA